jgi:ribonuclease J
MQLTIHRGSHQIGGNCVEVSSGSTRLILDVGTPLFNGDGEALCSQELRRMTKEELLQQGILPRVPGLFSDGPKPTAIVLSHAHGDHTGFLPHAPVDIPVYATRGTRDMMRAGRLFAGQVGLPKHRHRELRPLEPVTIGEFTVTAFPVDHSVHGSAALLVEAEGKRLLYSGDMRMHGRKPGMARNLQTAMADKRIDAFVMEGTLLGNKRSDGTTEMELEEEIVRQTQSASGLVLASFSPQHLDRLVAFVRAARRTQRIFVADVYCAYVMDLVRESGVRIPPPKAKDGIRVYYPILFERTYNKKHLEDIYQRFLPDRIVIEEILAAPGKYLMMFRPSILVYDLRAPLPKKTRCLYSRWEGYLEGPEWKTTSAALQAAGGDLIHIHTTGHILPNDLTQLLKSFDVGLLIPIHTSSPDSFREVHDRVCLLEDGKVLELV